jgi:hypothetical protein
VEPTTPGCSWIGAIGERTSQGGDGRVPAGGQVSALDDGAATVIDLSEWVWTRGRAEARMIGLSLLTSVGCFNRPVTGRQKLSSFRSIVSG